MGKKFIQTIGICIICFVTISTVIAIPVTSVSFTGSSLNTNDSSISIQVSNNFLRIDFVSPSVFRIRMNNIDAFPEGGMVKYGIVNTKCQHHIVKKNTKGNTIELSTDSAKIVVNKKDGRIQLFGTDGTMLIQNDQPPKPGPEQGFEIS